MLAQGGHYIVKCWVSGEEIGGKKLRDGQTGIISQFHGQTQQQRQHVKKNCKQALNVKAI